MKKILLLIALITGVLVAKAQSSEANDSGNEVVGMMEGEWYGKGWIRSRNGVQSFDVKEVVEYKENMQILVVEGLGTQTDSVTGEVRTVHNAYAVIHYSEEAGGLQLLTFKDGESAVSDIIIEGRMMVWRLEIPNAGTMRYTIDFSKEGRWYEIGEFTRDGETWTKIMEMDLLRK